MSIYDADPQPIPYGEQVRKIQTKIEANLEDGDHFIRFGPQVTIGLPQTHFRVTPLFLNETNNTTKRAEDCNGLVLIAQTAGGRVAGFRATALTPDFFSSAHLVRATNYMPREELDYAMELVHFHFLDRLAAIYRDRLRFHYGKNIDWSHISNKLGLNLHFPFIEIEPPKSSSLSYDLEGIETIEAVPAFDFYDPTPSRRLKIKSLATADPEELRQRQLDHLKKTLLPKIQNASNGW